MDLDSKCYELVSGAGLEPILMPRKKFVAEHKNLLKVLKSGDPKKLKKEYEEQKSELKTMTGGLKGVSKASGFIQRLMAENKKKHSGQYRNPTYPLARDSTMKKPAEFKLKKIANTQQLPTGENRSAYGASPFILKHFGNAVVPFTPANRRGRPPAPKPAPTPAPEPKKPREQIIYELKMKPENKFKSNEEIGKMLKDIIGYALSREQVRLDFNKYKKRLEENK